MLRTEIFRNLCHNQNGKPFKALEDEVKQLHHGFKDDDSFSSVHDLFRDEALYGDCYDVTPRVVNYYDIRVRLVGALVRETYHRLEEPRGERLNEVALEMALEHSLDLMMASESDTAGVRDSIGSFMTTMGKYQQAYDFLKFCMKVRDENEVVTRRPAFLQFRGADMFEPLEVANLSQYAGVHQCLDMALLKIYLFSAVRSAQLFSQVFDRNQDIATVIGGFVNAPRGWSEVNAGSLLDQAQQLLSCVHVLNTHVLPGFLNPGPLLEMDLYAADPRGPDFQGSLYQASLIMKKILPWWKQNRIAMNVASNFARRLPSSLKAVPEFMH